MHLPKARPGLLLKAACEHHEIHLPSSVTIGDSEAGAEAALSAALVPSGSGARGTKTRAAALFRTLPEAVRAILGEDAMGARQAPLSARSTGCDPILAPTENGPAGNRITQY